MSIKANLKMLFKKKPLVLKDKNSPNQNNKRPLLLLSCIVLAINMSLLDTVIPWISLFVACSTVIRFAIYFTHQKQIPSQRTLTLLALLSILGLIYSAWALGLLIAMVNLLVLACALKLMQANTQRDVHLLIVSLLFLIGCGFIFDQSIIYAIYYSLLTFVVIVSLRLLHAPTSALKIQIRQTSILVMQALPIAILLFLLLPQLPPLWQTPKAKSMQTGLADKISPGDIAQLSQSSELAFTATFVEQVPSATERYWRAIIMEDFDGRTWQVHPARKRQYVINQGQKNEYKPVLNGPFLDYDIIAEPTQQHWLFGLDLAIPRNEKSQNEIWQSDDFLLLSRQILHSQYAYTVRSYTQALAHQNSNEFDRQLNLQFPQHGNPRTQQWIRQLRKQYPTDSDLITVMLNYFRDGGFVYTLRPKPMLTDPIDTFLFDEKAGFCSHYASALAYSLRLAGIPARLVAGYQGGELTVKPQQSPYLTVYQYDAHAWVETWSKLEGWQRLDPTSVVAPDRITLGLRQAMLDEGSFLADSPFALVRFTNIAIFNHLRLFLADINYNWNRSIIGFNQQKQMALFKSIVQELSPQRMALLGLATVMLIALLLTLFFIPHWLRQRKSPLHITYFRAIKIIQPSVGLKPIWQGAQDFSQVAESKLPLAAGQTFNTITQLYIQIMYQNNAANKDRKTQIRTAVHHIKFLIRQLKRQIKSKQV